jgi:hypothetical protein
MSRDDELRTPAFSRVMQGANSRMGATSAGRSQRLVLTFATLCVVVITLAIITLRDQAPVDLIAETPFTAPPSLPNTPDTVLIPQRSTIGTTPRAIVTVKHIRHRRPVNELAIAMKLSSWRSPTDSLLKTSGDDKLMSLPKLGESLRTLRFYSLDELN